MAFPLPWDVDNVRSIVAQVDSGAAISNQLAADMLDLLEQHECWGPFFRLLKRGLEDGAPERERNYVRLARVQNIYLEDTFAAAETCASLVSHLRPGYLKFSEQMLPHIIEFEDFTAEATLLSAICDHLEIRDDHIACLERLCMLFEKKTHNEAQLSQTIKAGIRAATGPSPAAINAVGGNHDIPCLDTVEKYVRIAWNIGSYDHLWRLGKLGML